MQTPTLMVNGRQVPAAAPYDTLKQIVEYQAKLDGVAVNKQVAGRNTPSNRIETRCSQAHVEAGRLAFARVDLFG